MIPNYNKLNEHSAFRKSYLQFCVDVSITSYNRSVNYSIQLENDLEIELIFSFTLSYEQLLNFELLERKLRQASAVLLADYRRIRHKRRKLQSATERKI